MSNKDRFIKAIDDLFKLEDDWDTYGAPAPTRKIILTTIGIGQLLSSSIEYPEIQPEVDGTVSLYFENKGIKININEIEEDYDF